MIEGLRQRLEQINDRIEQASIRAGRSRKDVRLIAVTKTHPAEALQALIDLGVHDLGENRTSEILDKVPRLSGEFTMHMIGHLQTNKVGPVLPHIQWIQSVDRERLISRIEFLFKEERKLNVLIEVNTSGEESKSGCAPEECRALCEQIIQSKVLELRGFMTIGPLHGDEKAVRSAFSLLRELSEKNSDLVKVPELSMGMSGDFEWAIEEGSTMVRIGSLLLGERH